MSRKRHVVKARFQTQPDGSVMMVGEKAEEKRPVIVESADRLMEIVRGKAPGEHLRIQGAKGETLERPSLVKIRTTPIAWGLPLDEVVFANWFSHFLDLRMMPWDDVITSQSTYVPDARNIIHDGFLLKSKCEWLMMLDSDVIPPPDLVDRLMEHHKYDPKKVMIGGWYKRKSPAREPVVYDDAHELEPKTGAPGYNIRKKPGSGLESVDGAGAGCWLMHRSVAEALGVSPYDMNGGGEDLQLCRKIHDAGFETWIDWTVACAHAGVAIA